MYLHQFSTEFYRSVVTYFEQYLVRSSDFKNVLLLNFKQIGSVTLHTKSNTDFVLRLNMGTGRGTEKGKPDRPDLNFSLYL